MEFEADPAQSGAAQAAQELVQRWAEAVLRQTARSREVRGRAAAEARAYEHNEDWSPDTLQLSATSRELWTEEHTLVWAAYQLERWAARLARERDEPAPPKNKALRNARNALEHLAEADLSRFIATSPEGAGRVGSSLRELPAQSMPLYSGGIELFGVLDPEVIDRAALAVVASIESDLTEEAVERYAELMRGL